MSLHNNFKRSVVILSNASVCLNPFVSLNNEKKFREISAGKIAVCKKTAGLGFEFSVLESVSSPKNISVLSLACAADGQGRQSVLKSDGDGLEMGMVLEFF